MLFPKCFYPKCIFAKCTRIACLLSFASLFYKTKILSLLFKVQNKLDPVIKYLGSVRECGLVGTLNSDRAANAAGELSVNIRSAQPSGACPRYLLPHFLITYCRVTFIGNSYTFGQLLCCIYCQELNGTFIVCKIWMSRAAWILNVYWSLDCTSSIEVIMNFLSVKLKVAKKERV